jgi:hypothetical protein
MRRAVEKPPLTLARLMAVVGVVAVNTAAARALYFRDEELALGLALMGLASQFALLRAIRRRGLARAFWSGFVTTGLAAMAMFAWGISFQDSVLFGWLLSYTRYADGVLALIPSAPRLYGGGGNDLAIEVAAAFVWFIPQLLAAMVGGLSAALVTWLGRKREEDRNLEAAPQ